MTFYDQNHNVIFEQFVEAGEQSSLSFLGAVFDDPIIAYAQITAGTDPLQSGIQVSLNPIDLNPDELRCACGGALAPGTRSEVGSLCGLPASTVCNPKKQSRSERWVIFSKISKA